MSEYPIVPSNEDEYYPVGPTNFGVPVTNNSEQVSQDLQPQQPNLLQNPSSHKLWEWEQRQKEILESMGGTKKQPHLPHWAQPVDVENLKQQRIHNHQIAQQQKQQQHAIDEQQKAQAFAQKVRELEAKESELRKKFEVNEKNICLEHQQQVDEVWNKAKAIEERYNSNEKFFRKVNELLGDL